MAEIIVFVLTYLFAMTMSLIMVISTKEGTRTTKKQRVMWVIAGVFFPFLWIYMVFWGIWAMLCEVSDFIDRG